MAYQYPNMGGVGQQFPGPGYMPQMNQPSFQGYPAMQQMGNPYMYGTPRPQGNLPQGYGSPGGPPAGRPAMPYNQYPQGMPNMQFQGQPQPQGTGRRPGLMSKLGGNQQPGMGLNPQGFNQFPQAGPGMQQPARRGLNLGRGRQGMAGGMPTQPMAPMPGMQQGMLQQPGMQQPMFQQPMMGQPNVSPMGKQVKPKQFTLNSVGGASGGSGIATIPDGNNLSLVANNLPDPSSISPGNSYVAYLTNRKGQGAFALGPLMAIGGGTYKLNFSSNVPFYDYDQVVVSLENPYAMQNSPTGQVVLASSGGAGLSLPKPVRKFFGGVWSKVKGAGKGIGNRIGGGKKSPDPQLPEAAPNLQNLFNNYTLGPTVPQPITGTPELPGLGSPMDALPTGETP